MPLTEEEFVRLVKKMRSAQVIYLLATYPKGWKEEAKRLERIVDGEIERILGQSQGGLFT